MMKKLSVVLLFFCHLAFADCLLYESKDYANEGAETYRESCESYGGGGIFSYSVSESSSDNTCDGVFAENAFVLRVSCNTCGSREMKEELEENKKYCNEVCRTPMMTCMTTLNAWGSTLNGSRESCGLEDYSLPGCEESSSSSEPKSSSSESSSSSSSFEEKSSSSEALSSSEAMSSSIDNNPFGFTEGMHLCSTEATYYYNLDGNYCQETGFCKCYQSNTTRIKFFTKKPNYYGQLEYSLLCFAQQNNPSIIIKTNLPYVTVEKNGIAYCFYDIESCEHNWNSNYATYAKIPTVYGCRANSLNYTVPVDPARGCSVTKNTDNDSYGMIFIGEGMTESSTLNNLNWLGRANVDQLPANFSFYDLLKEPRIVSSFESCLNALKHYNSMKSSSSQFSSSSEESNSSSEKYSSSNGNFSSSSKTIELSSSSMEMRSSSSVNAEMSSSSKFVESSSSKFESSSTDGVFVAGPEQEYTSDQIFKDGLDNMESGKCYSLNPARGTQHGWINTNAQDSWWWREVDCETGEKVDNNRVGACLGFPLDNVPSNPKNACFAYNGTCYKCNPARGSECSNFWLWQGTFTSANIGWWYEQVDCDNPFGEKNNLVCPDASVLYKKTSNSENFYFDDNVEERQKTLTTYFYFDAVGRSMKRRDVSRVKRAIYVKSRLNRDTSFFALTSGSKFNALFKTVSGHVSALTSVTFSYSTECSNEDYVPLNITIMLSTPEDGIEVFLEGDDDDLKNHEQKHKSIYMKYGNDSWTVSTTISRRMTKKSVCEKIKNDYWMSVESKFRTMLNLQNAWDDEDKNNVSHERINVDHEIERLKKQWQNSKCE